MRLAVATTLIALTVCPSVHAGSEELREEVLHHARCATIHAAASRMGGVLEDDVTMFADSSALLEFALMNQDIQRANEEVRASLRNKAWIEQSDAIGSITRAVANSKDTEAVRIVFEKLFALCETKPGRKVADND